ncbi:hypothetical protein BsWGS_27712 [Bradybaena similaris]
MPTPSFSQELFCLFIIKARSTWEFNIYFFKTELTEKQIYDDRTGSSEVQRGEPTGCGPGHPPDIYITGGCQIKTLVLKENKPETSNQRIHSRHPSKSRSWFSA